MFNTGNSEFINEFSSLFFISEIANYLCVVGILIILTRFKLVEEKYFIFWCLYFLTPFFGNYVLFDPLYMPDQYIYTNTVNEIRADGLPEIGLSNYDAVRNSVTNLSSIFFSFVPLFSNLTITSVAFANQIYTLLIYIYLRNKIKSWEILALLLLPSFILYSSVSLREVLIIFFTVISLISLIEKKYLVSLLCIFLIFIFKIQNSIALLIMFFGVLVFRIDKSITGLLVLISLILIGSFIFFDEYIPFLNLYRNAFALEAGIDRFIVNRGIVATEYLDFVWTTAKALVGSLVRPFPWQTGGLGIIIFFENIFILFIVYKLFQDIFKGDKNKVLTGIFLLLGLLVTLSFYAYTISNLGTLSRYRFTTIYPFLFAFLYIQNQQFSQENEKSK